MSKLLTIRDTCRLCGSHRIVCSVPLARVPIVSPNVGTDESDSQTELNKIVAPLDNYMCQDCGLIQLIHVVDPELIYRNYLYRTKVSLGLAEHFQSLSNTIISRMGLAHGALVVEFGSNDGTLLAHFHAAGMRVCGVDPASDIAAEATAKGIPTRADFFGPSLASELAATLGPASVVLANNAIANIDDLASILRGVKILMAPDGAFVFETQYALDVFERFLLDAIYHEHISTFSVQPVVMALNQYELEVFDVERIATKGGSIRFWVQHSGGPRPIENQVSKLVDVERRAGLYDPHYHTKFSARVKETRTKLHTVIAEVRRRGDRVGAYGSSVGCAALIHQFELEDCLDFLIDDMPFKEYIEGPNYRLPVFGSDYLSKLRSGLVIILAWRYANTIAEKNGAFRENGGRLIIPLPEVRFLD